jgi:hypothetical protein
VASDGELQGAIAYRVLESLEQSLETSLNDSSSVISEPQNTIETTQTVSDSLEVPTEPLTAKALAHRLNVSPTTISKRKSKPDFPEWARSKDPEGILWTYSKTSHHFVALVPTLC